MLKLFAVPVQVKDPDTYTGVTVMVPTTGTVPVFTPPNVPMFPLPPAPNPMLVLSLIQLYPVAVPLKVTAAVLPVLHTTWLLTAFTVGVGSTLMLKLFVLPLHVPYTGVTTMFAVTAVVPALLTLNTPMFPLPLPARPMPVLSFTHV